jgi:hypothetical protein
MNTGATAALLAVDLGLKLGLAFFAQDGRLLACRSQNLGTRERLRRDRILRERRPQPVGCRGRPQFESGAPSRVSGHSRELSAPSAGEQVFHSARTIHALKEAAQVRHRVAVWSGVVAKGPWRHDAAEAVALGYWAVCSGLGDD